MKKILCIFGTRPEAIKMAPLILGLKNHPHFTIKICITAQHRSMLDQILNIFEIQPDYDLNIMMSNQTLSDISTKALMLLPPIFEKVKPDRILVQGDTTTTLIASLSAFYHKISIAHIEAGLRTHNKHSPWPEEINRKLTSGIADLHFAPTIVAKNNLLKEAVPENRIFITGNTVIDALLITMQKIHHSTALQQQLAAQFSFLDPTKKLILVTGHRRENFGEGFKNICYALQKLASARPDVEILYPVHLNPNVQKPVKTMLSGIKNIHLIEPQDYLPFVYLLDRCYIILTDSGGIQEEAPTLGKPVLVMRDTTERPEGISAGTVRLVGTNPEKITVETTRLLNDQTSYQAMSQAYNPYGDGTAAQKIIAILENDKESAI